jgi:hypothetical protein
MKVASLLLLLLLALGGCVSPNHLTTEETRRVVARAREVAQDSGLASAEEKVRIAREEPALSYYFIGRPLAQYTIRWALGADDLVIAGQGDILRLDGAQVMRVKPAQSPAPTSGLAPGRGQP